MTAETKLPLLAAGATLFILACATLVPPAATPAPTETPGPTNTPAPPPTATFVIKLTPDTPVPSQTADPDAPDSWACRIRSQAPTSGARFAPKQRFDIAWQLENTGWATWEPGTVRATYYSGRRLQAYDEVPLRESVAVNEWTLFVVPMIAPRATGSYTTVWALRRGDDDFCHMTVTIVVR
jgi:hypothetical protein